MKTVKGVLFTAIFTAGLSGTASAGGLSDLLEALETTNKIIRETREIGETLSGSHGNKHGNSHNSHNSSHNSHGYDSYSHDSYGDDSHGYTAHEDYDH